MSKVCVSAVVLAGTAVTTLANGEPQPFFADIPVYSEEAAPAGIDTTYDGPWEYFVGGGVATFDCNRDRLPDVFIAGGQNASALYVNESEIGGALSFDKSKQAATSLERVTGAYPVDIDNDAWIDLVVLRVGENRLLKGGPDCQFTPANASFGFDGGAAWSTAFSASFGNGDLYPTLAFGNYVDRTAPGSPWGTCEDNVLLRPQVNNDGSNVSYDEPTVLSPGIVRFRCCSQTGTRVVLKRFVSLMIGTIIEAAKSSSGISVEASIPGCIREQRVGNLW